MNRATRTLVVIAVALIAAFGASLWVYRAVQRIPVREVEVASVYFVVAAKSMPVGTKLAPNDLKLVAWPARNPVAGGFTTVEQATNRGLMSSVVENEPITESKLAPIEAGAGLSPTIPPGMRAISLKVNEVIGVAGFAVPGTRVDVVVTVSQNKDSVARVVLTNVQVLTAGTLYDQQKAKDGQPIASTVVTLLVTPEDAEKVALASREGTVTLALRNPLDVEPTKTNGVRLAGLFGPPSPPPPALVARRERSVPVVVEPPPPPPRPYTVEAIRGAKRSEEVVK